MHNISFAKILKSGTSAGAIKRWQDCLYHHWKWATHKNRPDYVGASDRATPNAALARNAIAFHTKLAAVHQAAYDALSKNNSPDGKALKLAHHTALLLHNQALENLKGVPEAIEQGDTSKAMNKSLVGHDFDTHKAIEASKAAGVAIPEANGLHVEDNPTEMRPIKFREDHLYIGHLNKAPVVPPSKNSKVPQHYKGTKSRPKGGVPIAAQEAVIRAVNRRER